jgi:hypothetical protein
MSARSVRRTAVGTVLFVIDPPTLQNLGFEWFIEGDEDRNATVAVSYREAGATGWRQALPLLRELGAAPPQYGPRP